MNIFKISSEKLYWVLFVLYLAWIGFYISAFITSLKYSPPKSITENYFIIKIMVPIGILVIGILLKYFGFQKIANWVMGIPALVSGSVLLLSIMVWIFLAVVFILFGKN